MEVDLWQLPIPHWGQTCPQCHYPLCGLPTHRCPECGLQLDMAALVRTWTRLREPRFTGGELPIPDFGLSCHGCGGALAGWHRHECPECGRAGLPAAWRPSGDWFAIEPGMTGRLLLPVIEGLLADELIPFFTRDDKSMMDIIFGSRSLGTRVVVASEFYFDFLWVMRRENQRAEDGRRVASSESWQCPACGESVPGNFDVCWNCGEDSE